VSTATSQPHDLAERTKALALAVGFDLAGISDALPRPETEFLREWLARGYAAEMGYLEWVIYNLEGEVVELGSQVYLVAGLRGYTEKAFTTEQAAWDWREAQNDVDDYDVDTMDLDVE
jgi:hypothetical protein